eukprot:CAMPEP_0197900406 /NCGR_PEP_ID=MMETSP1439-20131203/48996_1 /TAXON_ID=66791 /ORGANISM="Gonyaulax spinifera, Strain CCMP409" /LENGTH=30 /DNA_ID= /DNA_START= /DNA_END= /DNA_ORIENTATION=
MSGLRWQLPLACARDLALPSAHRRTTAAQQ